MVRLGAVAAAVAAVLTQGVRGEMLLDTLAARGELIDVDGDGAISLTEMEQSDFFKGTDENGDGTLELEELRRLIGRLGGGDLFKSDINKRISEAMVVLDTDNEVGIQGSDLASHWGKLTALLSADDVAEWIAYAVLLPQYAENFRHNGVKGMDLPLLLENEEFLRELGVTSGLHTKQILRSISMRFLGLGRLPPKPLLTCTRISRQPLTFPAAARVSLKWALPTPPKGSSERTPFPVHKWRLLWRAEEDEPWQELDVLPGGEEGGTFVVRLPPAADIVHLRIEAWNIVGRSAYAFAACGTHGTIGDACFDPNGPLVAALQGGPSGSQAILPQVCTRVPGKDPLGTSAIFSKADRDGDGDIDASELEMLMEDLSKPILTQDAGASTAAQSAFLRERGAAIGINAVDDDDDSAIVPDELEQHWRGFQRLLTVERTAEWLRHAVELPQYVPALEAASLTGIDLPKLTQDGGSELRRVLGISDDQHLHLLVRAITIMVMGIGRPPAQLVHVEARPGDLCGSVRLDWGLSARAASSKSQEMPIHKFRVLRRDNSLRDDSGAWVEVYSGMSNRFEDRDLHPGHVYSYRVESWNLLGVSPVFETHPTQPEQESCMTASRVVARVAYAFLSAPFMLASLVVDNYYRISALASVAGFFIMAANVPPGERRRGLEAMHKKIVPLLRSTFGITFGVDALLRKLIARAKAAADSSECKDSFQSLLDERTSTLNSPHQQLISRAVEATFPRQQASGGAASRRPSGRLNSAAHVRPAGEGALRRLRRPRTRSGSPMATYRLARDSREPSPLSPRSHPSDTSKWGLVRQHLMQRRVVKAWTSAVNDSLASSDTECSSLASVDASPKDGRIKRSATRIRRALSRRPKYKRDSSDGSLGSAPALSLAVGGAPARDGSLRACSLCGAHVSKLTRHICGSCHLVYCDKHTAVAPHSRFFSCGIESRCVCVKCHGQWGEQ